MKESKLEQMRKEANRDAIDNIDKRLCMIEEAVFEIMNGVKKLVAFQEQKEAMLKSQKKFDKLIADMKSLHIKNQSLYYEE